MYQQTSLLALIEAKPNIGKRQEQILDALNGKILNNREISLITGLPINCTTPRVNELVKYGKIVEAYKDKDSVTNRTTIFWKLKE